MEQRDNYVKAKFRLFHDCILKILDAKCISNLEKEIQVFKQILSKISCEEKKKLAACFPFLFQPIQTKLSFLIQKLKQETNSKTSCLSSDYLDVPEQIVVLFTAIESILEKIDISEIVKYQKRSFASECRQAKKKFNDEKSSNSLVMTLLFPAVQFIEIALAMHGNLEDEIIKTFEYFRKILQISSKIEIKYGLLSNEKNVSGLCTTEYPQFCPFDSSVLIGLCIYNLLKSLSTCSTNRKVVHAALTTLSSITLSISNVDILSAFYPGLMIQIASFIKQKNKKLGKKCFCEALRCINLWLSCILNEKLYFDSRVIFANDAIYLEKSSYALLGLNNERFYNAAEAKDSLKSNCFLSLIENKPILSCDKNPLEQHEYEYFHTSNSNLIISKINEDKLFEKLKGKNDEGNFDKTDSTIHQNRDKKWLLETSKNTSVLLPKLFDFLSDNDENLFEGEIEIQKCLCDLSYVILYVCKRCLQIDCHIAALEFLILSLGSSHEMISTYARNILFFGVAVEKEVLNRLRNFNEETNYCSSNYSNSNNITSTSFYCKTSKSYNENYSNSSLSIASTKNNLKENGETHSSPIIFHNKIMIALAAQINKVLNSIKMNKNTNSISFEKQYQEIFSQINKFKGYIFFVRQWKDLCTSNYYSPNNYYSNLFCKNTIQCDNNLNNVGHSIYSTSNNNNICPINDKNQTRTDLLLKKEDRHQLSFIFYNFLTKINVLQICKDFIEILEAKPKKHAFNLKKFNVLLANNLQFLSILSSVTPSIHIDDETNFPSCYSFSCSVASSNKSCDSSSSSLNVKSSLINDKNNFCDKNSVVINNSVNHSVCDTRHNFHQLIEELSSSRFSGLSASTPNKKSKANSIVMSNKVNYEKNELTQLRNNKVQYLYDNPEYLFSFEASSRLISSAVMPICTASSSSLYSISSTLKKFDILSEDEIENFIRKQFIFSQCANINLTNKIVETLDLFLSTISSEDFLKVLSFLIKDKNCHFEYPNNLIFDCEKEMYSKGKEFDYDLNETTANSCAWLKKSMMNYLNSVNGIYNNNLDCKNDALILNILKARCTVFYILSRAFLSSFYKSSCLPFRSSLFFLQRENAQGSCCDLAEDLRTNSIINFNSKKEEINFENLSQQEEHRNTCESDEKASKNEKKENGKCDENFSWIIFNEIFELITSSHVWMAPSFLSVTEKNKEEEESLSALEIDGLVNLYFLNLILCVQNAFLFLCAKKGRNAAFKQLHYGIYHIVETLGSSSHIISSASFIALNLIYLNIFDNASLTENGHLKPLKCSSSLSLLQPFDSSPLHVSKDKNVNNQVILYGRTEINGVEKSDLLYSEMAKEKFVECEDETNAKPKYTKILKRQMEAEDLFSVENVQNIIRMFMSTLMDATLVRMNNFIFKMQNKFMLLSRQNNDFYADPVQGISKSYNLKVENKLEDKLGNLLLSLVLCSTGKELYVYKNIFNFCAEYLLLNVVYYNNSVNPPLWILYVLTSISCVISNYILKDREKKTKHIKQSILNELHNKKPLCKSISNEMHHSNINFITPMSDLVNNKNGCCDKKNRSNNIFSGAETDSNSNRIIHNNSSNLERTNMLFSLFVLTDDQMRTIFDLINDSTSNKNSRSDVKDILFYENLEMFYVKLSNEDAHLDNVQEIETQQREQEKEVTKKPKEELKNISKLSSSASFSTSLSVFAPLTKTNASYDESHKLANINRYGEHRMIATNIIMKMRHYVLHKDLSVCQHSLVCILRCFLVLTTRETELLPAIHQVWPYVSSCFHDETPSCVLNLAMQILVIFVVFSDDFVLEKFKEDVFFRLLKRVYKNENPASQNDEIYRTEQFQIESTFLESLIFFLKIKQNLLKRISSQICFLALRFLQKDSANKLKYFASILIYILYHKESELTWMICKSAYQILKNDKDKKEKKLKERQITILPTSRKVKLSNKDNEELNINKKHLNILIYLTNLNSDICMNVCKNINLEIFYTIIKNFKEIDFRKSKLLNFNHGYATRLFKSFLQELLE